MSEIIQVSLRGSRREFYLNSRSLWLRLRDRVVVQGEHGESIAMVLLAGTEFLHTGQYLQPIGNSTAAPFNYTDFLAGYLQFGSVSGIQVTRMTWSGLIPAIGNNPLHQDFTLALSTTGVGAGGASPVASCAVRARAGVLRAPGECATVFMAAAEPAVVELLDVTGRVVRELLRQRLSMGATPIFWDLKDAAGSTARPGMFFVRLRSASGQSVSRFALLR